MLTDKNIVLGVTGGIAAYKAADLASKLTQEGAAVNVIMTDSAIEFISPLTFRALTHHPVVTSMFELSSEFSVEHVALAEAADVVVIAPATANIIAKMAAGIADDMLTCTVLATEAPVIVAPAMNVNMWQNSITQENIAKLKARGLTIVDPEYGRLASGRMGMGRLAEVSDIIGTIKQVLGRNGDLAKRRIVVTAGGSREAIDPVRYIGNRSSGKMGFALAEAARDRGAIVVLVAAATSVPTPAGIEVINVESVAEMKEAVIETTKQADVLIMSAAVSDFRMAQQADQKIKKQGGKVSLELVGTEDFLLELPDTFIKIGFAAETENLLENARKKLNEKRLQFICANDVTAADSGFGTDTNKVTLLYSDGRTEDLPLMSKREVADIILDRVVAILEEKKD
jgi:phosphopantothenoylcysteine decarboxylase/phosphopantothenate--cysteine ligase